MNDDYEIPTRALADVAMIGAVAILAFCIGCALGIVQFNPWMWMSAAVPVFCWIVVEIRNRL